MPVERSDVGAWLVKGDPDTKWDYWGAVAADGTRPGDIADASWSVGNTYRNGLIENGDLMLLYLGGKTSAIVEIGVVTNDQLYSDVWDPAHLIDASERRKVRLFFDYRSVHLRAYVTRQEMKQDATLRGAEVIRVGQLTNPSYLTPEEVAALLPYLTKADLKGGGWTQARPKRANVI